MNADPYCWTLHVKILSSTKKAIRVRDCQGEEITIPRNQIFYREDHMQLLETGTIGVIGIAEKFLVLKGRIQLTGEIALRSFGPTRR